LGAMALRECMVAFFATFNTIFGPGNRPAASSTRYAVLIR
jgi:hypothetical protein